MAFEEMVVAEGTGFPLQLQFNLLKLCVNASMVLHDSSPESSQHGNITP